MPAGSNTDECLSERDDTASEETPPNSKRRTVLRGIAATGFLSSVGTVSAGTGSSDPGNGSGQGTDGSRGGNKIKRRVVEEFQTRRDYSRRQLIVDSDTSPHSSNDRVNDSIVISKFGKSLPHEGSAGVPTNDAYVRLVEACEKGTGYDEIPQAYEGATGSEVPDDVRLSGLTDGRLDSKPLVQPESAWTYLTASGSTAQLRIATPPAFDSTQTGAEMVELYWRALTRDVNFHDYGSDDRVAAAASELDSLDGYAGPVSATGRVEPDVVFRGVTPGARTGPYVSQFLWKDRPLGGGTENQQIEVQSAGSDYLTTVEDWLKVQRGIVPPLDETLPGNEYGERRYIVTGRDMCERVHDDPPFRQIQKAAQVLVFGTNAPLDDGIPYVLKPFDKPSSSRRAVRNFTAQTTLPFNDFGPLFIEKTALAATEVGQYAAWHKKWNVHRRLRPEEYGGRVEAALGDGLAEPDGVDIAAYLPDNLLDSEALARSYDENGSYLLSQAYAEGSPTHPSYPAGHSVVAGAGVTVLKALFDEDYEFGPEEKVVPTPDGSELQTAAETDALGVDETLTVGGELNKLASNMALGRNRAGIHYRSDGIEGLRLGEAAAVRYLEDQLALPQQTGEVTLSLTTFDDESVVIEPTV